jgi:hypothetical protein
MTLCGGVSELSPSFDNKAKTFLGMDFLRKKLPLALGKSQKSGDTRVKRNMWTREGWTRGSDARKTEVQEPEKVQE